MRQFVFICCLLVCGQQLQAQFNTGGRFGNMGGGGGNTRMQRDTTRHDHEPDTLTITYRYLGEPTDFRMDSSITDFSANFLQVPSNYVFLGNSGGAARNIIFTPRMKAGFDAGFHSYDVYGFSHENARIFTTNRPYSELRYLIGSKQEQGIGVMHTQNRTDRFNFAFEYKKINSPGYFRNQNTNHDLYRVTSRYNSRNKRYNAYLSFFHNKIQGGENGGIRNDSFMHIARYNERRTIDVNLGNQEVAATSFFSTSIPVKTAYKETGFLLQQQYDWGRGDTIHVNDTTDFYKFDPVFRVQYTFQFSNNDYGFSDGRPDTFFYTRQYGWAFSGDTVRATHRWRTLSNDLSLIQFPVRGNQAHFISVGARFENISGTFLDAGVSFNNLALHGEYRNKTRNQRWDFSARGELYAVGQNIGDYSVSGMLSRYLNETWGNVHLFFSNVNREPSYVYKYFSSTYDTWYNETLGKENITQLQFAANNRKLRYNLAVNYFILNNYVYFTDYSHSAQSTNLFNLLQVVFAKHFQLKKFHWYADLAFQQVHGDGPLNVPTVWTRHRFSYENKLFNNLHLMAGIEGKYNTDYYADDYSPVPGQFVYQRTQRVKYNLPDLAAFVHFRIKSFSAYIRGENLNAFLANNNYAAPLYPYNNFALRIGIRWWYIN